MKILKSVIAIAILFAFSASTLEAQTCRVSSLMTPIVNKIKAGGKCVESNANFRDYYDVEITIVNPARSTGTHFYTAFAKANLNFNDQQCKILVNDNRPVDVTFSDRKAGAQAFSKTKADKSIFSIDTRTNTLNVRSVTWRFNESVRLRRSSATVLFGTTPSGKMYIINLNPKKGYCLY